MQPLSHTVAAPGTCGCRPWRIRLQVMGTALFERLSCLNHSCDPNAEVCVCMHAQHTVIASATHSYSLGHTRLHSRWPCPVQAWPYPRRCGRRSMVRTARGSSPAAPSRAGRRSRSRTSMPTSAPTCARPGPPRPNACVSVQMCARPGPIFVCMHIHHADMYLYICVLTTSRAVRDFALRLGSIPIVSRNLLPEVPQRRRELTT